ncbi:hypothetical protein DP49_1944 [Burkholderia pseudomallei]|uniref:transposase n=1 Tax=Burkholderia pseudomallei TaxID=28450 RepID=UPI00050DB9B6|nr:transposase [Burkholderia pseudomallei]KGD52002.1 hypothetical protein DP49_1944 [Burkholderia pseudomallei]
MSAAAPAYVPLTDDEWKAVEHVFSTYVYQLGAPSRFSDRVYLDAILHAMTIGCAFSALPQNLGYPKRQALCRRAVSMRLSMALPKAIAILRRGGRPLPEEERHEPEAAGAVSPCSIDAFINGASEGDRNPATRRPPAARRGAARARTASRRQRAAHVRRGCGDRSDAGSGARTADARAAAGLEGRRCLTDSFMRLCCARP